MRVLLTAREGAILARTKAIGRLEATIVDAPRSLRDQLRRGTTDEQLNRCARLRTLPSHSVEHRATVRAIRAIARRALMLEAEAAEHDTQLEILVLLPVPNCSSVRPNRAGDRQFNRALHTVALTRLRFEPTTKAHPARRTVEGKTPKRTLSRSPPPEWRLDRQGSILAIGLDMRACQPGTASRSSPSPPP
jgi:transposase